MPEPKKEKKDMNKKESIKAFHARTLKRKERYEQKR